MKKLIFLFLCMIILHSVNVMGQQTCLYANDFNNHVDNFENDGGTLSVSGGVFDPDIPENNGSMRFVSNGASWFGAAANLSAGTATGWARCDVNINVSSNSQSNIWSWAGLGSGASDGTTYRYGYILANNPPTTNPGSFSTGMAVNTWYNVSFVWNDTTDTWHNLTINGIENLTTSPQNFFNQGEKVTYFGTVVKSASTPVHFDNLRCYTIASQDDTSFPSDCRWPYDLEDNEFLRENCNDLSEWARTGASRDPNQGYDGAACKYDKASSNNARMALPPVQNNEPFNITFGWRHTTQGASWAGFMIGNWTSDHDNVLAGRDGMEIFSHSGDNYVFERACGNFNDFGSQPLDANVWYNVTLAFNSSSGSTTNSIVDIYLNDTIQRTGCDFTGDVALNELTQFMLHEQGSEVEHIDEFRMFNSTGDLLAADPDFSNDWNVTSAGTTNETAWQTARSGNVVVTDSTPTVTFTTTAATNASISTSDQNYTDMGASAECSTNSGAGVTSHTCTLGTDLQPGQTNVYISLLGNQNATSTSGALSILNNDCDYDGATGTWSASSAICATFTFINSGSVTLDNFELDVTNGYIDIGSQLYLTNGAKIS